MWQERDGDELENSIKVWESKNKKKKKKKKNNNNNNNNNNRNVEEILPLTPLRKRGREGSDKDRDGGGKEN